MKKSLNYWQFMAVATILMGAFFLLVMAISGKASAASSQRCVAVDGDTLSCLSLSGQRRTHIRLSGIDAPEMPGHCHAPRVCAPGDPLASKANLAGLIAGKTVKWRSLGRDKYGRTIALPSADGVDLSCAQLTGGFAIFKSAWDNGHRIGKSCPAAHNG